MILPVEPTNPAELLDQYPTRELQLARIHDIERYLARWEREDEENDPVLIQGHIRLTRGFRFGCATFWLCLTAMSIKVVAIGHRWVTLLAVVFGVIALAMLVRGLAYRPDPKLIYDSYEPHRTKAKYLQLVEEMELLTRALSQGLRAEDLSEPRPGA